MCDSAESFVLYKNERPIEAANTLMCLCVCGASKFVVMSSEYRTAYQWIGNELRELEVMLNTIKVY